MRDVWAMNEGGGDSSPSASPFLDEKQLAERWQVNPGWLATLRSQKRGPKYVKIGFNVRYRVADIVAFERENEVSTSGEW